MVKFDMYGQLVDMVFASLQMPTLPDRVDVLDLKCLKGLDEVNASPHHPLHFLRITDHLVPFEFIGQCAKLEWPARGRVDLQARPAQPADLSNGPADYQILG